MTNRVELRDIVAKALLAANTVAQNRVYTALTFPTKSADYPLMMVQIGNDYKTGVTENGPAQFDVSTDIIITARLDNTSVTALEQALYDVALQIEKAVIGHAALMKPINKIASVHTQPPEIFKDARIFTGDVQIVIVLDHYQAPEEFAPMIAEPLEGVDMHLDMQAPYDPEGTYENPAFPESTTEAPRTSGPDGRDEGALNINLPQT